MSQTNPLPPTTLVIFGITGDLVRRYLLPALYQLAGDGQLPEPFTILGITRRELTIDDLIAELSASLKMEQRVAEHDAIVMWLTQAITIVTMDSLVAADYHHLTSALVEAEKGKEQVNRLYYLSIPPQIFSTVIENMAAAGLNTLSTPTGGENRLLVEKPFGYDLASAHELIDRVNTFYTEEQVYRIDHYLAKEASQNILAFRFNNPLFDSVWNNKAVCHILITAAEAISIEGRVNFYEHTGALRDLIQSHLMQLMALVTMERPASLRAADIHDAKLTLMKQVRTIQPEEVAVRAARGQYATYRDEVKNAASHTETYAALNLQIDNDRWRDVPIFLETGKSLHHRTTEITLVFTSTDRETDQENRLTFRIQPNEGISLDLLVKMPHFEHTLQPVEMSFEYARSFADTRRPDAYERVLFDAMKGDKTLFATSEEVLESWRVIEAVVQAWRQNDAGLEVYEAGVRRPEVGEQLTRKADAAW